MKLFVPMNYLVYVTFNHSITRPTKSTFFSCKITTDQSDMLLWSVVVATTGKLWVARPTEATRSIVLYVNLNGITC